jgi:hypothetical protein
MSFERDTRQRSGEAGSGARHDAAAPGKHTLTEDLGFSTPGTANAAPALAADPMASAQNTGPRASSGIPIDRLFGGHSQTAVQRSTSDAGSSSAGSSGSAGARMVETTVPFTAVIRHASDEGGGSPGGANPGSQPRPTEAGAATPSPGPAAGGSAAGAAAAPDGTALHIPEMGMPVTKGTHASDAIGAAFSYLPTTTRGGVTLGASEFGQTTGSLKHFSNVVITPGSGKFTVTADLKQTVNWDTRATEGPNKQKNVGNDTDPVLTKTNYPQVVKDLTPDTSDLKGRPPRDQFWAKDLTETHELYHVKDYVDIARKGSGDAEKWLGGQTASKKEDVPALLDTAWTNQIFNVWDKFTDPPAVEERAYSDGAPLYKGRADSIKVKGDKGDYK